MFYRQLQKAIHGGLRSLNWYTQSYCKSASIYTVKLQAIFQSIQGLFPRTSTVIFDSPAIFILFIVITDTNFSHILVQCFRILLAALFASSQRTTFIWAPGHIGISGTGANLERGSFLLQPIMTLKDYFRDSMFVEVSEFLVFERSFLLPPNICPKSVIDLRPAKVTLLKPTETSWIIIDQSLCKNERALIRI